LSEVGPNGFLPHPRYLFARIFQLEPNGLLV